MARHYSTSDEYMAERSDTLQSLFTEDLADFTAFDPGLSAAFADDWQTAIDAVVTAQSGETVDDQVQQLTQIVDEAMKACRKKYIEVKYFFTLAYPGNKAVMKEMGADDYEQARKRQMRLVFFSEALHAAAEKFKTALLANGYTQARIDEIGNLAAALKQANKNQNALLKGRPSLTQDREKIYNDCYAFTERVCEAALSVYYDNEVKQSQYVFEPSGGGGTSEFFEGELAIAESKQIDDFTYNASMHFVMGNTGGSKLEFCFKQAGVVVGNVFELEPGTTLEKTAADFAASGDSIWVRNVGAAGGAYELEETI